MGIEEEFIASALNRLKLLKEQGTGAISQVKTEEQLQWMPSEESNSIAMIVRHLYGNMKSRWTDFLTTDGEKEDRNRPSEFFVDTQPQMEEMWKLWEQGWEYVFTAIESLSPSDLQRTITIRGKPLSVIDAIHRQMLHYSAHIGQITYIAKMLVDKDWKSLSIPRQERYSPSFMQAENKKEGEQ